jgi:general secretion pathway protein D
MKNSTHTKARTLVLVTGALGLSWALATSLAEAALAEGADQKPVKVAPGGAAPPSVNIPALRKRRDPPGAAAAKPPAAAAVAPEPSGAAAGPMIGEKEFNSCKKFPSGKRIVKLNLKPDTELGDLIAWISSITCKQFLLPGTIPANSKKVTIVAPELITPEEAYRLFLGALDSVGLTVQPSGKVLRIIETVKAKSAPIPLYGEDSDVPMNESYVTRLIRVENADPNEVAQVLGRLKSEQGDVIVYAPQGALIVTDLASNIQRMMAILKQIDQPGSGEKVWIIGVKNTSAMDMAQKLGEIFQVAKLGGKGGQTTSAPPPAAGARP